MTVLNGSKLIRHTLSWCALSGHIVSGPILSVCALSCHTLYKMGLHLAPNFEDGGAINVPLLCRYVPNLRICVLSWPMICTLSCHTLNTAEKYLTPSFAVGSTISVTLFCRCTLSWCTYVLSWLMIYRYTLSRHT